MAKENPDVINNAPNVVNHEKLEETKNWLTESLWENLHEIDLDDTLKNLSNEDFIKRGVFKGKVPDELSKKDKKDIKNYLNEHFINYSSNKVNISDEKVNEITTTINSKTYEKQRIYGTNFYRYKRKENLWDPLREETFVYKTDKKTLPTYHDLNPGAEIITDGSNNVYLDLWWNVLYDINEKSFYITQWDKEKWVWPFQWLIRPNLLQAKDLKNPIYFITNENWNIYKAYWI